MAHEGASQWIELVLARAADLRAAGVLSIAADGYSATLAPRDLLPALDEKDRKPVEVTPEPRNVFEDPASYPLGEVPGFEIHKFDREEF